MKENNLINEDGLRIMVDLKAVGNANGTKFVKNNLKDAIDEIESEENVRVVGIVYDGTYNLEILTQPIQDLDKIVEEVTKND
jgi:phage-related minor tail protein